MGSLKVEPYPIYESYLQRKMTKAPFLKKGFRAINLLEVIHTDVCGPVKHIARGGFSYFITFTDDYSYICLSISNEGQLRIIWKVQRIP